MDQFTHMQHDQVWSSRQKAAATKIALEATFVVCCCDSIKKTAKGQLTLKLSSHMCDTTRHNSLRHDTTEDQDTAVFKFGATHTTTRPCD